LWNGQEGLGLIEVMVAFVLLVGLGVAINRTVSDATKAAALTNDLTSWNAVSQRVKVAMETPASCLATLRSMSNFSTSGFSNLNSSVINVLGPSGGVIAGGPYPRKVSGKLVLNQIRATPFQVTPGNFLVRVDVDASLASRNPPPATAVYTIPTAIDSPAPKKATFSSFLVSVTFSAGPTVECTSEAITQMRQQVNNSQAQNVAQMTQAFSRIDGANNTIAGLGLVRTAASS
jgi:hypothetical protein